MESTVGRSIHRPINLGSPPCYVTLLIIVGRYCPSDRFLPTIVGKFILERVIDEYLTAISLSVGFGFKEIFSEIASHIERLSKDPDFQLAGVI